jgi:hypothetical protein
MPRCRCAEIRRADNDISALGRISKNLGNAATIADNINRRLGKLSANVYEAVYLRNINNVTSRVQVRANPLRNSISSAQNEAARALSRVQQNRATLQREDRLFHHQQALR